MAAATTHDAAMKTPRLDMGSGYASRPTGALFEEVVERLPRARWRSAARRARRRRRFPFHRSTRLELRAFVPRILRRDPRADRLAAFERCTRVEVHALGARVQRAAALRARAVGAPRRGHGQLVAAADAADDLAESGHVERLGRNRRLAARGVLFLRLRPLFPTRLARFILVSTLTVFAIGHTQPVDPTRGGPAAQALTARRAEKRGSAAMRVRRIIPAQATPTLVRSRE